MIKKTPLNEWLGNNTQKSLAKSTGFSQPAIGKMLHKGRDITVNEHYGNKSGSLLRIELTEAKTLKSN